MDDDNEQSRPVSAYFRLWLCGAFRVERRIGTVYEAVRATEWAGSSYPRLLLKALLCCPGRQARREALLEMLWPDAEPEQAAQYFNTATTKLRAVLRPAQGHESLLLTENDAYVYRLADQQRLWVDVDEALALLKEAEGRGRTAPEVLLLLEAAADFFNKGALLQDEEGLWVTGRRATLERARYRCRLWLAEAYEQQGMAGQAEMVLSTLLEEDPLDEDVLCRVMVLLHGQHMTHQALRLYQQTCGLLAGEGLEPAEATKALAVHIREERDSTQHLAVSPISNPVHALPRETIDGVQQVLELPQPLPVSLLTDHSGPLELASATRTLLSLPSLFRTDSEVLAHVAAVLSKRSGVREREITYFDQQTRLYWRAREETALPATTLYGYVIRHIDDLSALLTRSHVPVLRSYLCETVCRTVLLAGILLYDMGHYAKARHHYRTAFQAATEANNPVLQAIVWGWRSFTWTYAQHYTKALRCMQRAHSFATQTTAILTQTWLGAIESEIQACLGNHEACLQALSDMEHGIGMSASQDISYLFEFNPALLLGYKGVCLQQLYQRQKPATHGLLQEAKEALEQALESEAPLKRKLYYLSDLAGVYARQGEVETACAYVVQSLPLIRQIGNGSKTIRKHLFQVRVLLRPNERTSSVQALDEQLRPLFMEMQTEDV